MIKIDALGLHLDSPLKVFHASLNASAIIRERQFKTRKELNSTKVGAGGGPDDLVSFTGDERVAKAVCVGLGTFIRLGIGDLTLDALLEEFKLACPNAYADFRKRTKIESQDAHDLSRCSSLYKYMLGYAESFKEALDPVFFGTNAQMYSEGTLEQLDDVGYLSANISSNVIIYPNVMSDFQNIIPTNRPCFAMSRGLRISNDIVEKPIYVKSEYRSNFEIAKDYQVENRLSVAKASFFAEYLESLNEYRVTQNALDPSSVFLEKSLFDLYTYDLPRLWKSDDILSFYPYFEYKQIGDNLEKSYSYRSKGVYNTDQIF